MGLRPGHSAVGSASALGAEGREFESRCPDQLSGLHPNVCVFFAFFDAKYLVPQMCNKSSHSPVKNRKKMAGHKGFTTRGTGMIILCSL